MSFLRGAEEDSDSPSSRRKAFQSVGAELEKALKSNYFFLHAFNPQLEYEGETEKLIEEIVLLAQCLVHLDRSVRFSNGI